MILITRISLGSTPDPAGGFYSAPPGPLAGFGGRFAAGGLGWGRGGKGGWEGEGEEMDGRKREGPQVTVEPGPLRALLRHCQSRCRPTWPTSSSLQEHDYVRRLT